jgi:hypothetical protein
MEQVLKTLLTPNTLQLQGCCEDIPTQLASFEMTEMQIAVHFLAHTCSYKLATH